MELFMYIAIAYLIVGFIISLGVIGLLAVEKTAVVRYNGRAQKGIKKAAVLFLLFVIGIVIWPVIIAQNIK